jgi:hypothetical protein
MEDDKKLLEIVKSRIYHGEMKKEEFLEAIKEAEDDILKDIRYDCEHTYTYKTSANGYGFESCSKCGKLK